MNSLDSFEKDSAKRSRQTIEDILRQAGAAVTGKKQLKCPFHDDHHPSAEIKQAASGFWYFYCYVCDISEDAWALKARVTGRDVGELLQEANLMNQPTQITERPKAAAKPPGQFFASFWDLLDAYTKQNPGDVIEEKNAYSDPITGDCNFYTLRILKKGETRKTFRQVSKVGNGWQWKGIEGKAPLFNRKRVAECQDVLIVEGEKCVREFTKLEMKGMAATTSPGGAASALKADWSTLAGKTCYLWRDYDEPGLKYENEVISELHKINCRVYRIRVEELDLDEKGDLVDYFRMSEGSEPADLVASVQMLMQDAEPLGITSALADRIDKIISGEFRAVPFNGKPNLSRLSKAILPGTVTTICGEAGAGKSFLVLEDAWRWTLQDAESVKILMLEEDDAFHQGRALAQISRFSQMTDTDYIIANPNWAKEVFDKCRPHLEQFARHMETANSSQKTLDEIADWVKHHAENGVRIIIVDPITAAKTSSKPWIDDQRFLFKVKNTLEETGASLILTTHPRTGAAGKPSLSGMAGGASYPRFSQCVFWLRNLDVSQQSVMVEGGAKWHKQVMEIRKARNAKGQGMSVAINLDFQTLCFEEVGIIDQNATQNIKAAT